MILTNHDCRYFDSRDPTGVTDEEGPEWIGRRTPSKRVVRSQHGCWLDVTTIVQFPSCVSTQLPCAPIRAPAHASSCPGGGQSRTSNEGCLSRILVIPRAEPSTHVYTTNCPYSTVLDPPPGKLDGISRRCTMSAAVAPRVPTDMLH